MITRPKERSQKLAEHLRDAGAEVLEFPTIELNRSGKNQKKRMLAQRIKKNCMNWFGIWNRITGWCSRVRQGRNISLSF